MAFLSVARPSLDRRVSRNQFQNDFVGRRMIDQFGQECCNIIPRHIAIGNGGTRTNEARSGVVGQCAGTHYDPIEG